MTIKFKIKQAAPVVAKPQVALKKPVAETPAVTGTYQGYKQEWLAVTKELSTLFAIVNKVQLSVLPIEQYNKLLTYSSHIIARLNKARQLVRPAPTVFSTADWENVPIDLLEAYCDAIGTLYRMYQDVASLYNQFEECDNPEAKKLVSDALKLAKINFLTFLNNVLSTVPAIKTYPGFVTNTAWLLLVKDMKRELANEAKNKKRTTSGNSR